MATSGRPDPRDKDMSASRVSTIPTQAAKRLHLHTRGTSKDGPNSATGQDQDEASTSSRHHQHHHHHHHHHRAALPAHAVKQIAKGATQKVHHSARAAYGSATLSRNQSAAENVEDHDEALEISTRPVRPEAVALERNRRAIREEELESSLRDLTDLATKMTRQLDTTYYAILEKAEQLRKTVDQLSELNTQSMELNERFKKDAEEVENRIKTEIEQFQDFKKQEDSVGHLEQRMHASMQHADQLSQRLEKARTRVTEWQEREAEWQSKTSARLRASAITVACTVVAIVLLIIIRWTWLVRQDEVRLEELASEKGQTLNLWELRHSFALPFRKTVPNLRQQALGDDKRLRLLDQL